MARTHIFSDEAGCFAFSRNPRASKYFLVCTVQMPDCNAASKLMDLRRDMVWRGLPVQEEFHATEDKEAVRHEVFDLISTLDFRADVTLLQKSKAMPKTRPDEARFYKYAWYYHFKHIGPTLLRGFDEAQITAAALGTKKGQAIYTAAVNDVIGQVARGVKWSTFFPRAVADPCLQIADYVAWAVQRKWERGETLWHSRIAAKIATEFDLWAVGSTEYY